MRRLALAALMALGFAAPAQADTFDVTSTADTAGTCPSPSNCTLRGALAAAANGASTDDLIRVPEGTYTIGSPLVLTGQFATGIELAGAGANRTIIGYAQPQSGLGTVLAIPGNATFTVRGVTLRNGDAGTDDGGNLRIDNASTLTLDGVRLTGGRAARGGGLAAIGPQRLNISYSLIDGNTSTSSSTLPTGGGIFAVGFTFPAVITVLDSTITANDAMAGGGLGISGNVDQIALRGVTLARNTARSSVGTGGIFSAGNGPSFQGSIIADNRDGLGAQANCDSSEPSTDEGGNVDSADDCGLDGRVDTDAKLSTALDTTQQPPVLTIPGDSLARDYAQCGGRTFDQRGVVRPQGIACDAGAYEYVEPVVEQPPVPTPTPTPPVATPTPTPTPTATPVVNRTVVVDEVRGTVKVRRRGSRTFEDIDAAAGIPVGSTVDTKRGTVELTSIPRAGATPQKARFFDGIFRISQSRGITNLTLTEQLAACPRRGSAAAAQKRKPKSRKLWGNGKGAFRTSGRYSAATVRGTKWLVRDSCAGTLTRVTQGSVRVRDNVRKRTIIVRAGKRYLARPRR